MLKENIKEAIVEQYFYLSQAMLKNDKKSIDKVRNEINKLINIYLEHE